MTSANSFLAGSAEEHSPLLSRRLLLGGALLATLSSRIALGNSSNGSAGFANTASLILKLQASIAQEIVPWFYSGRIYAVRSATAPQRLIDFEGTEIFWVQPQGDKWSIAASTLTFYRDINSGAYLDAFANPLTNKTVEVKSNVLRTRPGNGMSYAENGITGFGQTSPWDVQLHRSGGLLWLTTSRAIAGIPQPSLEIQTMFGDVKQVDDPKRSRVAAHFSSTTFSPWSRWMEMGSNAGHLVWHAAGRKLDSNAEIPADYLQRAQVLAPNHFNNPEQDVMPATPES